MRRLALPVLGIIALLALAAVAIAATGSGTPKNGAPKNAAHPAAAPVTEQRGREVVDLTAVSAREKPAARREKPAEAVTDSELEAIERKIKASSTDGAAPDDGVSPGAPSDKEVREMLREMNDASGAGPIRQGSGDMIYPVNGQFTSPFGQRWGRLHAGIDIAAPTGRPIRAAAGGRVILAAPTGGYGNYTCIAHRGGISTCYAHQSRLGTSVGDNVRAGDVIGYVGNTGNSFGAHLHFEVRVNGRPVDPMDYL